MNTIRITNSLNIPFTVRVVQQGENYGRDNVLTHDRADPPDEGVTDMKTIKIVPTWRGILPLLVEVAANGDTPKARTAAMDELYRLADIVDERNAQAAEEQA